MLYEDLEILVFILSYIISCISITILYMNFFFLKINNILLIVKIKEGYHFISIYQ